MSTLTLFEAPAPEVATTSTTTAPVVKEITWPTNYNNKLGCAGFIHLDLAPRKMPLRSIAEAMVFKIITADGSHPPVCYQLINIMKLEVNNVREAYTLAS